MAEQEDSSWVDALDLMLLSAFTAGWDAASAEPQPRRTDMLTAWRHYRDNIGKEGNAND